ncbi:MAG: PAS domain S-box protein, partial [Planctomycetota bacterium]
GLPFESVVDFRMMVERCSVPMVVTLPDGTVLYANRAALGVMEVDAESAAGRSLVDRQFFANPEQSDLFPQRQLAGENPVRERCQMITARGRHFEALIVHHAVRDAAGNICYGISTLQDISLYERGDAERKRHAARTTRRLVQSEARYHTLFQQIPEAIFLVDAGDQRIVDANPAAETLIGLPGELLLNRQISEFVDARKLERAGEARSPRSLAGSTIRRADGRHAEIEGSLQLLEYAGRATLLLIVRDVTWRRAAEAHIRMLSDAIDALPEGVAIFDPDGAIRYANAALIATYGWTDAELSVATVDSLGLHPELPMDSGAHWSESESSSSRATGSASRRRLARLTPLPEALAGAVEDAARQMASNDAVSPGSTDNIATGVDPLSIGQLLRPWSARMMVRTDRIAPRPVRLVCSPVYEPGPAPGSQGLPDAAPGLRGVVVVLHDMATEQQMQEHLLQSEKLASMGTLVVGLTRELNTHLAPIIGFAQLLGERDAASTDSGFYLDRIQESARAARRIMDELQDFAMPPGELNPVNVARLARDVATLMEYAFRDRGVTLSVDLEPGAPSPRVEANREQLRSVLMHLVRNALDACERGDGVRLRAHNSDAGTVIVEVLDEGHGLSPDVAAHMFDPFFTTRDVGQGIGLGLSVCYGVVRDLGGEISGENRSDRRGARFVVELPAWRAAPEAATIESGADLTDVAAAAVALPPPPPSSSPAASSDAAGASKPGRPAASSRSRSAEVPPELAGRTVLIVDDEPSMVSLLTRLFTSRGFVVRAYTDPERALNAPDPSDLVITDVWMPILDGVALRDAYRRRWPQADTRFIFITGDTADGELERVIRTSGDVVVQKPFDIARILQQAISALGGGRKTSTGRFERG